MNCFDKTISLQSSLFLQYLKCFLLSLLRNFFVTREDPSWIWSKKSTADWKITVNYCYVSIVSINYFIVGSRHQKEELNSNMSRLWGIQNNRISHYWIPLLFVIKILIVGYSDFLLRDELVVSHDVRAFFKSDVGCSVYLKPFS